MTLPGRHVVIEVCDPWDYAGPDGSDRIPARILEARWDRLIAEAPFNIDVPDTKVRGRRLVLCARHVGGKVRDIARGKRLAVGIAIIPNGESRHAAVYAVIGDVLRARLRRPPRRPARPQCAKVR